MFPVFDRGGRVVAFSGRILPVSEEIPEGIVPEETGKYINSPETPIYHKGELLYGLTNARTPMRQSAEALVVEGNFDVVQMHQHGFTNTVAPLGTSFTDAQAKLLRRFAETVVLVFDGDEAGRKAARASHAVCAKAGLIARVTALLPRAKDPDAFLRTPWRATARGDARAHRHRRRASSSGSFATRRRPRATTCPSAWRAAAARAAIADVRDGIEREVYVKHAAKALYLDERAGRACRCGKRQSHAARAKRRALVRRSTTTPDEPGAHAHRDEGDAPCRKPRAATTGQRARGPAGRSGVDVQIAAIACDC